MSKLNQLFHFALVALGIAALAPSAQAAYMNFANDAMSAASGFSGGSVSGKALTVTDAAKLVYVAGGSDDSLNRKERGWYAGATIGWPGSGARAEDASMQTSRMASSVSGEGDLSGTTLTFTTEKQNMHTCMATTTWWGFITPEEAYAKRTGNFKTTLTMSGRNYGATTYGVNSVTFTIEFPVDSLVLRDDKGVQWYPVVATNGTTAKVYGDLNVALEAGGEVVSVADAAITNAITLEAGVTFRKNGKTITGLEKLTLLGGSYDFDPDAAGCNLGICCVAQYNKSTWLYDVTQSIPSVKLSGVEIVDAAGATNATAVVKVDNTIVVPGTDGTYTVPKDYAITVTYTAKDDYMFGPGWTKKVVTLDPLTDDYAMTDDDKPVAEAMWADVREIMIDTRSSIIVCSPEEVLPIWYAAGGEVQVKREGDEQWSSLVKNAAKAGTLYWTPTDLGLYTLTHPGFEPSLIIYSQPFPLSITQPAEGGSFVAITNGVEATGTFEVLGFENVTIAAKPAEHWQLKEMVALTNDVELLLKKDKSSITNQFEMPCYETVVTGAFVIAETYRAELLQAATNRYLATSNNLEKLRMHRLSEAETDAAIAAAFAGLNAAVGAIADATKPVDGESATNTLASALTEVYSDAKAKSNGKPQVFLIAEDYSAIPGFTYDAATGVISYGGIPAFTNGVNAYTSFTEAFTNETYGPFAQAINVVGRQTIAMDPPMVDKWCLSLASFENSNGEKVPAVISVDPMKSEPFELINITNNLFAILGEGEIILGKTDAPTTIYDEFIEERPMIDRIIVKNCGIEPWKNPQNNCSQIYIDDQAGTETTEEGETFVLLPGVEDLTGGIMIGVYPYATNDVKVAGQLEAPNGVVSIMNNSTNKLTLAGTVHGRSVGIYNTGRDGDIEGVIDGVSIVSDGDVEIQNMAHLEAYVVAGGKISIQNGNINTLVGSYAGSTIELLGNNPGALSNATFVSTGAVTMFGYNVLTGPFTIEAPSVDNSGDLTFSVANDNHTTWLNDFDLVGGSDFIVIVDEAQTDGEVCGAYVIASNATTAVGMTFSLEGGSVSASIEVADGTDSAAVEAKKLYIGAKAYSLRVDANGALVFEASFGKFAVIFNALGGVFADGSEIKTNDCYVNAGYALPANPVRDGYRFAGWYLGWRPGAERIGAGDELAELAEHVVYAQWTSTDPLGVFGRLVMSDFVCGRPVQSLCDGLCYGQDYCGLVTPLYLTEIGEGAFEGCANLRWVLLTQPRDIENPDVRLPLRIGRFAFAGTAIETVIVPDGAIIEEGAFLNCPNLKRIVFVGSSRLTCDPTAFAQSGNGTLAVYMTSEFAANNIALGKMFKFVNYITGLYDGQRILHFLDKSPVIYLGDVSFEGPGFFRDVTLRLSVPVVTMIPDAMPEPSIEILYSRDLRHWRVLKSVVNKVEKGRITVDVERPLFQGGFFKARSLGF